MKNSFRKGRGYFLQDFFEDIYFLSNNSVCPTRITHITNFVAQTRHIINFKNILSDFDQGIFSPMLLITFQTLKEETSIHACSLRGLGCTKL